MFILAFSVYHTILKYFDSFFAVYGYLVWFSINVNTIVVIGPKSLKISRPDC